MALIALDGACEYALWLAAGVYGIALQGDRASLFDLYNKLEPRLRESDGWQPRGWSAVKQLHRARNQAQHAAVVPDPGQLPLWCDAAWAFIDVLCGAAFGVALAEIVLADAVRDPELRAQLEQGEGALAEDSAGAFALVVAAFDQARERWRAQRRPGAFVPVVQERWLRRDPAADIRDRLRDLDDFLEVQLFAGDAGEYVWLRRARDERQSAGWAPSGEDARRALLFVTGWIVRWEIFDRGYPVDDWEAHRESIQPPIVGDGEELQILGADTEFLAEVPGRAARCVLHMQLANVPGRGRRPWEALLRTALEDSAREAGRPGMFLDVAWWLFGWLRLHVELKSDPDVVADIVRGALQLAFERHRERLTDDARREEERARLEVAFRDLVHSARSDLDPFGEVRVIKDEWLATNGWLVVLELREGAGGVAERVQVFKIFQDAARQLPHLHDRDGNIAFQAFALAEESEQALRTAIGLSEDQIRYLRDFRTTQARDFDEFAARIQRQFGSLPE